MRGVGDIEITPPTSGDTAMPATTLIIRARGGRFGIYLHDILEMATAPAPETVERLRLTLENDLAELRILYRGRIRRRPAREAIEALGGGKSLGRSTPVSDETATVMKRLHSTSAASATTGRDGREADISSVKFSCSRKYRARVFSRSPAVL